TVVYHLKSRDSAFITNNMYVLSPTAVAEEGDSFGAHPVCAGPFMFDERVAGDHITVVKSQYWYRRSTVHLDKIVYKPTPVLAAPVAALRAGDIDALDQVGSSDLGAVQSDSDLRVLTLPQLGWRGLIINVGNRNGAGRPPYASPGTPLASSPRLRQAFEEAIDRAAMNEIVFGGLYQTTSNPIPPPHPPS